METKRIREKESGWWMNGQRLPVAFMEFRKMIAPDDEQLQGLSEMLKKESDRQGRYQCRHCGFLSHSYLWQCPGCGGWDTYPTLRVQDQSLRRDK